MISATPSVGLDAAAPVAMFHTDVDGLCGYTNPRWHELTGLSFEESLGDGWVRAIHPDDRVETFARWTAAVSNEHRDLDLAFRIVRPDGEVRIARSRAARSAGGWVGIVDDVTEQHRTQERLQLVLEATNDGFWDWNIQTGDMTHSDRLVAMLGYTHRDMPPSVRIHADDDARAINELRDHLEGGSAQYESEHRLRCANGQWLWVLDRGKVVARDAMGNPLRMTGTLTDISKRRDAEADLNRFFSLSIELLCVAGLDGRFKRLNPAFETVLGYTREEMLERPLLDFVHPDDREATERELAALVNGRFALHFENRCLCKDGSIRWIAWTASPVVDEKKIYAAARDITRAKAAEQALRDSEQRTRSIIDNSISGLVTLDEAGEIRSANPAAEAIFGCAAGELIHRHVSNFLPNVDRGARGRVLETEARRRNAEAFPCEVTLFEFGSERHLAAHVVDVSERFEIDRMKNDFVSTVSHELRTPLTSIRGALGMLTSGVMGELNAEAGELVDIAARNSVRLISLINDILDFEKLERGRMEMDLRPTQIAHVIERSIESVGADEVRIDITAADGIAVGDEDRLTQVMVNLLSNAIKFSPREGVVTVSAGVRDGFVEVRVADRGRGISAEDQKKLFARFQQVDTSDARRKGGTGLGLAICKSIIEQHGGAIGVESEEGEGALFWFRVPAAVE